MAEMAAFLPIASTVLNAATPIISGLAQDRADRSVASQLDANANTVVAMAQREAEQQRKQGRLALSRLQAVAGGGGLDPGVVGLAADIAAETEYRAMASIYEGDERAAGMRHAAATKRYEGRQARTAGMIGAATSVFKDAPGLFEKYGKGGFDFAKSGYGDKY